MKKFFALFLIMILVLFAAPATAADITFAWDANTEADLAGYRLYVSQQSGQYQFGQEFAALDIPAGTETASYTVPAELDSTLYFVVTAYDDAGNESGPSNEVSQMVDMTVPENPQNLTITIQVTIVLP